MRQPQDAQAPEPASSASWSADTASKRGTQPLQALFDPIERDGTVTEHDPRALRIASGESGEWLEVHPDRR